MDYFKYKILFETVFFNIFKYKKLLLAFSGGLDSTVLLDVLYFLPVYIKKVNNIKVSYVVRAMYIDHGLHSNSIEWVRHCAAQCAQRNIKFSAISVSYNKRQPGGIENMARNARYCALINSLYPQEVLLTAHHLNDQVETLILALKRGSGPTGLSAMKINSYYYGHRLLRPFLTFERTFLEEYAYDQSLTWIKDSSNFDVHLDRNFLRIHILPLLSKRWPWFFRSVERSAMLCTEQEILLDELLSNSLKCFVNLDGSLSFSNMIRMSPSKRNALLRRWLSYFNIRMPSYEKLQRICATFLFCRKDAIPILRIGDKVLRSYKQRLYVLPKYMAYSLNMIKLYWYDISKPFLLPQGLGLLYCTTTEYCICISNVLHLNNDMVSSLLNFFYSYFSVSGKISSFCCIRAPSITESVFIHFGRIDDRLYIVGKKGSRKIKKLLQEGSIPPWLRSRIPLLYYNDILISGLGSFVTKDGNMLVCNESNIVIVWLQFNNMFKQCSI